MAEEESNAILRVPISQYWFQEGLESISKDLTDAGFCKPNMITPEKCVVGPLLGNEPVLLLLQPGSRNGMYCVEMCGLVAGYDYVDYETDDLQRIVVLAKVARQGYERFRICSSIFKEMDVQRKSVKSTTELNEEYSVMKEYAFSMAENG